MTVDTRMHFMPLRILAGLLASSKSLLKDSASLACSLASIKSLLKDAGWLADFDYEST